jgi:P-type E1-E2 ATPase
VPVLAPVSLVAIGCFSLDIFRMAGACLVRERRVGVDVLDAVVVTVCVAQRQLAGAALIVWVLDIVDILRARARNRSEGFITDAFGSAPRHAWLLRDGEELRTEVRDLKRGDVIVVQTGDQIPVDGRVAAGAAMIDQHRVTGESAPVERHADDKVYAMTVLVAGRLEVEVQETGADTLACQVVQIIEQAASSKTEAQSSGERIAERMVLPTLGLATLGYFTAGNSGMLAIINADYGTGIRIAAPIGLLSTLGRAARHGVLIEESGVLGSLRDIDVVLFDKTGTLTYDVPAVSAVVVAGTRFDADAVIRDAAAAERKLFHPLARAVLAEAKARGLELPGQDG